MDVFSVYLPALMEVPVWMANCCTVWSRLNPKTDAQRLTFKSFLIYTNNITVITT